MSGFDTFLETAALTTVLAAYAGVQFENASTAVRVFEEIQDCISAGPTADSEIKQKIAAVLACAKSRPAQQHLDEVFNIVSPSVSVLAEADAVDFYKKGIVAAAEACRAGNKK